MTKYFKTVSEQPLISDCHRPSGSRLNKVCHERAVSA